MGGCPVGLPGVDRAFGDKIAELLEQLRRFLLPGKTVEFYLDGEPSGI